MNENDLAISSDQHSTCSHSNDPSTGQAFIHTKLARTSTFWFLWWGKEAMLFLPGQHYLAKKAWVGGYSGSLSLSKGVERHLCFFVSHKSLASILENLKSKWSARIERWSLCLWPHDARVIYRAGTNSPADSVSCHPSCETKPTRREEMAVGTLVREVRPLHQGGRAMFRIAGQWEGLLRAHF